MEPYEIGFFRVPAEVRQKIYHLVFDQTPNPRHSNVQPFSFMSSSRATVRSNVQRRSLIYTCRKIYHEALPTLLATTTKVKLLLHAANDPAKQYECCNIGGYQPTFEVSTMMAMLPSLRTITVKADSNVWAYCTCCLQYALLDLYVAWARTHAPSLTQSWFDYTMVLATIESVLDEATCDLPTKET